MREPIFKESNVTSIDGDVDAGTVGLSVLRAETKAEARMRMAARQAGITEFFAHSLTQVEWRKAVKFTSTKATAVTGIVKSTTGYVLAVNCDGTRTTFGTGDPASNLNVNFGTPPSGYANLLPKFYAIFPCTSAGTVSGDLTYLNLGFNQLTSLDVTGLSALQNLQLSNNRLTSFDVTGLSALTYLDIADNQITSLDVTGLSVLTFLNISRNLLTSFDATGLSTLTSLYLTNNQLTSFDATGLSSLQNLQLDNNQLTSFDATGLSSLQNLQLGINQLTSFDATGLNALTSLHLTDNQLTSVTGLSSLPIAGRKTLQLDDNLLSAEAINAIGSSIPITTQMSETLFRNSPGVNTADPALFTSKNWTYNGFIPT